MGEETENRPRAGGAVSGSGLRWPAEGLFASATGVPKHSEHLDVPEKIDGSPLMIGQPAPTRGAEEVRQVVRIRVEG